MHYPLEIITHLETPMPADCLLSFTICLNLLVELPLVILWAREAKREPETWVLGFKPKDSGDFLSLDSHPHQCFLLSHVSSLPSFSLPFHPLPVLALAPSPSLFLSIALNPTLEKAMGCVVWELI